MDPRMTDKGGLIQPENEFQIRNSLVHLTPNPILPRSNGISVDSNGNQLGRQRSDFSSFFNKRSEQTSNYNRVSDNVNLPELLNHSSSYSISNYQMGNAIFTSGNRSNLTAPLNQSSGSYDTSNYQMGNGILQGGNNFNLNGTINQITLGNGNLGTYRSDIPSWSNSPMASNRGSMIGNTVQQPSFCATNISQFMIPKTNSVISSPLPNLNMQPLSSAEGINPHMNLPNAPLVLNSYSEVDSSWTEGNFTSLLLGDEVLDIGPNKWLQSNNSPQMLNNGFLDPVQHYNLNSPPRHGGYAGTSNANSFPFAPITPDHTNLLEKHQQAQMLKFLVDDNSYQEHDKMENLLSSIGNETIKNHCSGLLQPIVDSSASVVSTPQTDDKISEERGDQNVIDLNETPNPKAPKRRKHRPKVVIEGKPKRTPKAKTPNNGESEKNPSGKRKYVRKNRNPEAENTTPQQTDVTNTVKGPNSEPPKKSCRKRLNFDFEQTEGGSQHTKTKIKVSHHQGNEPMLDLSLSFPANQTLVNSLAGEESRAPTTPSEIISDKPLNIMARNLSNKTKENRANRKLKGETGKNTSRANINIERSREIRWKSTHQMVERDVGNFKGFCGSKGEGSQLNEQMRLSSEQNLGSSSICREPFQSGNEESISQNVGDSSEETCKKQKMENDIQSILSGSEKGYYLNGTSNENPISTENSGQTKLTALNQRMVQERMRERTPSESNQVHSTGNPDVTTNSNLQSSKTAKKTDASGSQQGSENYQARMQINRFNMTANPCTEVSFCANKVPLQECDDSLLQYRQLTKKARGRPKVMKYSKKMVDEITFRLQSLSISGENGLTDKKDKYALVPYEGGGAVVAYEPKKRKPRPKVDLDPETTRIWKLLMGKEGVEASEAENRNKEKWWEEERRVFHGRAESFIARMHLVQGNRRFSPWKGSVVDSIIGVFLTQNVSDQLSSSAFMALAAQFPLGSTISDQASDESGTSILTEEPQIQGEAQYGTIGSFDKIIKQPFYSQTSEPYLGSWGTGRMGVATETHQITEENASSSQNSSTSSIHHINGEIQSSSGSSSEAENSSNGAKPIKNNDLTGAQQAYRLAPLQVIKNPENKPRCFDDRSMLKYNQSLQLDPNKQIQGSDGFNNFNTFSPLNQPISSSISSSQNSTLPLSFFQLLMAPQVARSEIDCCEISREECRSSFPPKVPEMTKGISKSYQDNRVGHNADMISNTLFQQNGLKNSQTPDIDPFASLMKPLTVQKNNVHQIRQTGPHFLNTHQVERSQIYKSKHKGIENLDGLVEPVSTRKSGSVNQGPSASKHTGQIDDVQEGNTAANNKVFLGAGHAKGQDCFSDETNMGTSAKAVKTSQKHEKEKKESFDWDSLRKKVHLDGGVKERSMDASDSMDYEAMRCADVNVISDSIRIRGMNNMLSERIKAFLNRVVTDHGSIDLEWLRDVPPDKAKDYLLSIRGLGLKSVECVRLLTLHHLAFPVDTNVGRIAVRLGWVPLQPLPESLQLHLLEMYPVLETVQKYLWPRLCKLDQKTLYELHYQLITFGKVFCTKSKPNCNACPMRGECRHFASAFASARLALPAPDEKSIVGSTMPIATDRRTDMEINPMLLQLSGPNVEREPIVSRSEPIIEEPATPEPEITEIEETDIEDVFYEDPDEIPMIRLNVEQLAVNLRNFMEEHTDLQEEDMSKALVALAPEVASIPAPKLKYVLRLRTERQVYVLTDTHPLVKGLDKREPDDPSPYLLALLAPGEEVSPDQPSEKCSETNKSGELCNEKECSSVSGEANSLTVRGTLLVPCRTAMRGSFPLNGTYFQVNEVFADHESSLNPIDVPREWLWHLETRTVFFGTSATSIFRGMTTKEIQNSFWRGFVCVRGFDRKTRAPRPLNLNLHLAKNKTAKTSNAA